MLKFGPLWKFLLESKFLSLLALGTARLQTANSVLWDFGWKCWVIRLKHLALMDSPLFSPPTPSPPPNISNHQFREKGRRNNGCPETFILICLVYFLWFGGRHTCQCSWTIPGSCLGSLSWLCFGDRAVSEIQLELPASKARTQPAELSPEVTGVMWRLSICTAGNSHHSPSGWSKLAWSFHSLLSI